MTLGGPAWMLQRDVDIFTVSRWLGHKSVAITERSYAFLRTKDLHKAVKHSHKNRHMTQG